MGDTWGGGWEEGSLPPPWAASSGARHLLSQPALTSRHLPAFLFAFISPASFLLGCLREWISTHLYYGDPFSTHSAWQPKPLQTPLPPTPPQVLSRAASVCVQNRPPWQETVGPGIESKCRHNTGEGSVWLLDTGGRTGQMTRGPCRKNTYLFPLGDAVVSWACLVLSPLGALALPLSLSLHTEHTVFSH